MRQADDPDFDAFIQRTAHGVLEIDAELDAHMNPPSNATYGHLDKAARGVRIRVGDIAHTTYRDEAINFAHPDLTWQGSVASSKSAVLAVRNSTVTATNDRVLERVRNLPQPPAHHTCTGITTMRNQNGEDELDGVGASERFMDSLNDTGVPPHTLRLWEGQVCMVMRNLNADLKNGTRVIVDSVSGRSVRVVEPCAYLGPGGVYGDASRKYVHFIPRILFQWTVKKKRRTVERRQFPLRAAYAMTCNKSQGKTMARVALDLTSAPFAHGQLHVPVGRVHKRDDILLYITEHQRGRDDQGEFARTVNVVEREAVYAALPEAKADQLRAAFPAV
jgi:hypothetical protein